MSIGLLLKLTAGAVITLMMTVLFGVVAIVAGPDLEGTLFPVIEAHLVAGSVHRAEGKELCWTLHMKKFRNDAPAYFNYRIRVNGERVPLAVYRTRDNGERVYLSTYGFANHVEGAVWDTQHCAELPRGMDLSGPFLIEGEGLYETWHHRWLVPQTLPSFEVPGV